MKTKIIIGIVTGFAILLWITTNFSVSSGSGQAIPRAANSSPGDKDGKFSDMGNTLTMSFSDYVATAWEFFFTKNQRTPNSGLPIHPVDASHFNTAGSDQLNVTWLGHSSLMINIDGYKILADPVFEKRISLFGPTRFNGDVPIDIQQLPKIDAVVISHDHYDHLNKFSVQRLIEKTNHFVVPLKVGARLKAWGVPPSKIIELGWWQEYRFDQQLMVAATPAQHFSGRGIGDRNKTLWASWVIQGPHHSIFFSGDSGYFDGFKKVGAKYGPFDMTFLECGAYGEAWPKVHMFPEQTVQAHLDLQGAILHPIHWGTFNLALHTWYDPMVRLSSMANSKNIKIATPIVGETTVYNGHIPSSKWWIQPMKLSMAADDAAVSEKDI